MEQIRQSAFDTDSEKLKVVNQIIANQNRIERDYLQKGLETDAYNKAVEEFNTDKIEKGTT